MATEEIILKVIQAGAEKQIESAETTAKASSGNSLESKFGSFGVAANQTLELMKKIFGVLKDVSPALKGTFAIVEKSFMLALKPLADFVGQLLRPLALMFLRGMFIQKAMSQANVEKGEELVSAGEELLQSEEMSDKIKGGALKVLGEIQKALGWLENIPIVGQLLAIFETLFTKLGGLIKDIWVLEYEKIIVPIGEFFASIGIAISEYATTISTWVYDNIISPLIGFFTTAGETITDYATESYAWLKQYIIDPIKDFFKNIFNNIKEYFEKSVSWLKEYVLDPILNFFKKISTEITSAIDKVGNWIEENIINPIKNLFNSIINWVKNLLPGGSGGKSSSVSDAIIAPGGKVITTDPQDYLIATKDPNSLLGSNRGTTISTMNVNIAVQELNSDTQLRELADKISKEIQRKISYGSSGGY